MKRSPLVATFAAVVMLSSATQAAAQFCKPALKITKTRFTEAKDQKRIWSAAVAVDASHCAARSGAFEIKFILLKENGPDLLFGENFKWSPGLTEVSLDFWWDEAVEEYWIGNIASCNCVD